MFVLFPPRTFLYILGYSGPRCGVLCYYCHLYWKANLGPTRRDKAHSSVSWVIILTHALNYHWCSYIACQGTTIESSWEGSITLVPTLPFLNWVFWIIYKLNKMGSPTKVQLIRNVHIFCMTWTNLNNIEHDKYYTESKGSEFKFMY